MTQPRPAWNSFLIGVEEPQSNAAPLPLSKCSPEAGAWGEGLLPLALLLRLADRPQRLDPVPLEVGVVIDRDDVALFQLLDLLLRRLPLLHGEGGRVAAREPVSRLHLDPPAVSAQDHARHRPTNH